MLRRLDEAGEAIGFFFEGREIKARRGDSVASALLLAGIKEFRTTAVSDAKRGPYCMMGICFECLVEIDGVPNRQACMTLVEPDMRVRRQHAAAELAFHETP
ncbi:(2Fe-2S)-binding protein [Chelativorans sp. AA-79]|nr:(2Fe-2S)-binding protein [Chelativorans sp. AA-79]WEX11974.1 (2Fe-2S)-binding protein [Chelativorans sp. AA-79]